MGFGVTPAQQAESTLISAFGKSAFRINAFDTTHISVQSPTSSIFFKAEFIPMSIAE